MRDDLHAGPSLSHPGGVLQVSQRGALRTVALPTSGALTVGRSPECEVELDDSLVSRQHARIHLGRDGVRIEDLGSQNGTTLILGEEEPSAATSTQSAVEARLEPHRPTPIPEGARIHIGTALLILRIEGGADAGADPALEPADEDEVITADPKMRRLHALARRVARSEINVVLLGESGVGKEVFARRIHGSSHRSDGPFLGINCGALTESLLESELFGHEKGAFTGAAAATPGLLESAQGGTLFLDEVAELSPATQVKLLRVFEERQVLPVGGRTPRPIDVRFVAATNRDLEAEVEAGLFREDLYYRLNGIALLVPPLRERASEIEPLARHFLERFCAAEGRRIPALSDAALDLIRRHPWRGNVRELKNVLERAAVLCPGGVIEPEHICLAPQSGGPGENRRAPEARAPTAPLAPAEKTPLSVRAGELERSAIVEALEACQGNQTRAARMLGITRRMLIRRLDKYGLPRPRKGAPGGLAGG